MTSPRKSRSTEMGGMTLLPCPHCGAEADAPWREFGGYQYVVMCSDRKGCGAFSGLHKDRATAIAAWNLRALALESVREEALPKEAMRRDFEKWWDEQEAFALSFACKG